jgi:hypothetical protein
VRVQLIPLLQRQLGGRADRLQRLQHQPGGLE